MTRGRVKLEDVARHAGVHTATASRALNPATRGRVNDDTLERILRSAEELGYQVNPLARGLRTSRSMTVGILIPDLTNPFYPPIIRGIEDELSPARYVALLGNTDNNPAKERTLFDTLRARQVDGFIIATARRNHPLIEEAARAEVPMVLVSRTVRGLSLPAVNLDDHAAARLAVEHLHSLGHTAFGHVMGPASTSTSRARREGFVATCRALGLKADALVEASEFSVASGERAAGELLDRFPVTAIVGGNDLIALGCVATAAARGLSCPADISITGMNDMDLLNRTAPPLTTVHTPKYQMGRSAGQLLLDRLAGGPAHPVEIRRLQPSLVVRGSTAPPRPDRPGRRAPAGRGRGARSAS
jgi:LacI family transcriptional regulator